MKKTKVLHVSETFVAGVYTYIKGVCNFSNQFEDIETFVIFSDKREYSNRNEFDKDFPSKVNLIEIDLNKEISPTEDFKGVRRIYKEIKKIKPDVIHLHSSKSSILGRIASIAHPQARIYYTPHGYAFIREDISSLKKNVFKFIEKGIVKIFHGVTIACGDMEYEIAKQFSHAELVRNGVDVPQIKKYYKPHENLRLKVGIVGRITEARNPVFFNQIALKFPDFDFVWIGDGTLRDKITAGNIKITGWLTSNEDVYRELNKIDVYLQTSLWEGLPMAILEAMALKIPVIATNVIGNKDIVVQDETGFLFEKIEELDAYFSILKIKENRTRMGEQGLKRCENSFDTNKNLYKLISIYRNQ
ncbi:glycosyltransferase [Mariniflexile aquimaris]|uniref:Glycosyltransferase n=1 Tax=Mariniflexile aquimaris TaxID=881009 RepID=A0ABW3BPX9_9FLAO